MIFNEKTQRETSEEVRRLQKKIALLEREKLKFGRIENELNIQKKALTERVKELNCLYSMSKILGQKNLSLPETMEKLIIIILPAWQYQDHVCVRIVIKDNEFVSSNCSCSQYAIKYDIFVFNKKAGFIEIYYVGKIFQNDKECFLAAEKKLLKAVAELIGNTIEQKVIDTNLKDSALKLQKQKKELEEKNIALKELLAQIEMEKTEIKNQIILNVNHFIFPTLGKLKRNTVKNDACTKYLEVLERNLREITSSLSKKIIDNKVKLSPKEVEICNLIKSGFTNKQIADLLYISILTVERHRYNIRKKFGIAHQKVNLLTYLHNLQ